MIWLYSTLGCKCLKREGLNYLYHSVYSAPQAAPTDSDYSRCIKFAIEANLMKCYIKL